MELTIRIEQYARSAVLCLCRPPAGPRPLIFELGANLRAAFQSLQAAQVLHLSDPRLVRTRAAEALMRSVWGAYYAVADGTSKSDLLLAGTLVLLR